MSQELKLGVYRFCTVAHIGEESNMHKLLAVITLLLATPCIAVTSLEIGSRFSSDTLKSSSVYLQADYKFENNLIIEFGYNNFGDIKFNKFNDEFYLPYKTVRSAFGYHFQFHDNLWVKPSLGYELSTTELIVTDSYEYKLLSKYQGSPSAAIDLGWQFHPNFSLVLNLTATSENGDIGSRTYSGAGIRWTWDAPSDYSSKPSPAVPNHLVVSHSQPELIKPKQTGISQKTTNLTPSNKATLCLQVGVFKNPENAQALVLKGKMNGIDLQTTQLNNGSFKVFWFGLQKSFINTRTLIKQKLAIEPVSFRCYL
jgi:hypothetical protein